RLPHQADAPGIVTIRIGVTVEIGVVDVAGGIVEVERRPVAQRAVAVERAAQGELRLLRHAVADSDARGGLEVVGRVRGANDDRTADGIAPVECALRPLQYL